MILFGATLRANPCLAYSTTRSCSVPDGREVAPRRHDRDPKFGSKSQRGGKMLVFCFGLLPDFCCSGSRTPAVKAEGQATASINDVNHHEQDLHGCF